MKPQVSVVIPTYNRADLVLECLASLGQQEVPMEITVVDDGSTDGTATMVAAAHPDVRIISMPLNGGFAAAANAGIRAATCDPILLLNNDVTLAPGCLAIMLQSPAAMVAPLLLWRDAPEESYSCGDRLRVDGRPEAIAFRQPLAAGLPQEKPFGVSAACGLFRRSVFDAVGLLEESFVAYFEDADLCFRARLAGHDAEVCPAACAFHIGSASIAGNTWWRSAQCYRNHALLLARNMPWPLLWKHRRAILSERRHQRRMMFRAARAKGGMAFALEISLRYMLWLGLSLPHALVQRRAIQARRTLSTEQLEALLRPLN